MFGEYGLSLAIGVSQTMFRSHCLGVVSTGGTGSSLIGQQIAAHASKTNEGMETIFFCVLITVTEVHHSSPSSKEERVRACPSASPIAMSEHSPEHSILPADGFSPNCSKDNSCKTHKGVSDLG